MAVLAVMSIILAVALPKLNGHLGNARLETAALQMAGDIRYLQQLAATTEEEMSNYYLLFSPTEHKYRLFKNHQSFKTVTLPPGVNLESTNFPNNRLNISVKGLPSGGGGTVVLSNKDTQKHKYVVVASITGRVRVSETPP